MTRARSTGVPAITASAFEPLIVFCRSPSSAGPFVHNDDPLAGDCGRIVQGHDRGCTSDRSLGGEAARCFGLAPKSAADFAFLLHGFHFLKDDGVMAVILPHGVLFQGGAEERIRTKLLRDGHIDTEASRHGADRRGRQP